MAELPWYATFACAGLGACIAEVATLPIDTAKVRLQLLRKSLPAAAGSSSSSSSSSAALSLPGVLRKIVAEEGARGLYKGFWPAIHRQLIFASLRMGMYKKVSGREAQVGEAACQQQ